MRCRPLVDGAAAGAWVIDAHGVTALVNTHLADLLGTTVDAMGGHPFTHFMSAEQRDRAMAYLSKRRQGVAEQHDFEFQRSDGHSLWLSLATFPVVDAQGQFIGAMALANDITLQRQAQLELQQARQLSQATLDGLTAHVCVLDQSGTILAVNRAWTDFAGDNGAAPGSFGVGTNYLQVCRNAQGDRSDEAPAFTQGLLDVLQGRRDTFELQYPCHSLTEQRWFMATVSRLQGCEPARAVVAHQPVTTRVLTEAKVREAQRLESLGTLASGIAHDFNNILAAVLGHASLALDPLPQGHPTGPHLQQIQVAGQRARQLVQQILAFGRRQPISAEALALRPVVEETIGLLRGSLPASVQIVARLSDEPICVLADAGQVQQVLMNLGTNAWHALPGGTGVITITLARLAAGAEPTAQTAAIETAAEPTAAWAVMTVADNGVGMDQALRERIFEPFFTTQPPGQGTGLGLAIVHGIVAQQGGRVTVDSAPGRGSVFQVRLPLQNAAQQADKTAAAAPEPVNLTGVRVICIDDDPVVGAVVQALLQRAGCRVRSFNLPSEALLSVREQPDAVDLVVTDHSMPMMSGLQVAAELARIRPDLPVMLLSGYIADSTLEQAAALGIRHVVRKEAALEELTTGIARALAGSGTPRGGTAP